MISVAANETMFFGQQGFMRNTTGTVEILKSIEGLTLKRKTHWILHLQPKSPQGQINRNI